MSVETTTLHITDHPLLDAELEIHLAQAGDPTSTSAPLVLLHGGGVDHRMWQQLLELTSLLGSRWLLAPDARGHGLSSRADGPFRHADDVLALLDELEIDRAVLVGVSMGAATAVDAALEHPDRVAAVVASGAGTSEPAFEDPWTLEVMGEWTQAQQRGDLEGWLAAFGRFAIGPHRREEDVPAQLREAVATMARETIARQLAADADGVPIPPHPATPVERTWERAQQLTVPVLALSGALDSDDHLRMAARLAAVVPDGRERTLPDSAHYPPMEEPEAYAAALQEFLQEKRL